MSYCRKIALTAVVGFASLIAGAPVCGGQNFQIAAGAEIRAKPVGGDIEKSGRAPVSPVGTVPGMPPVINPSNLYGEAAAGRLSPAVADALPRVYVPNRQSNSVFVIDPATYEVADRFKVGISPQHVVPSWDLKTLWVAKTAAGASAAALRLSTPGRAKSGSRV